MVIDDILSIDSMETRILPRIMNTSLFRFKTPFITQRETRPIPSKMITSENQCSDQKLIPLH
uniref:Uncharacterized protein n=1 Tax=Cucumis melo TaxID=3656 RepID=A0A9I9E5Z0_CUCME